jgi:methylenetetrahydrofolate reductase (NADPH)
MQVIDYINGNLAAGKTHFTIEVLPPLKGEGPHGIFEALDNLVPYDPAFINVTHQREVAKYIEREGGLLEKRIYRHRPGTVGISAAIRNRYGIEVVPHLICGGMSRYDIEDALIDLDFLGIHNVLALRGDSMTDEKRFNPHPQGHAVACRLVEQIADMNNGIFIDGEVDRSHQTTFCIGVAGYPEKHAEAPNLETDICHLKAKVDAGARFIITQMSYDNAKIFAFIERCREAGITVPIVPGIKPLATLTQITVLPRTFHVDLPQALVSEALKCKDNRQARELGVEWAIEQSRELKKAGLPVIHYYTMGKSDNIAQIVKNVF